MATRTLPHFPLKSRAPANIGNLTFGTNRMTDSNLIQSDNVAAILQQAMDAGEGVLRLTPTWVPRSFPTSRQATEAAPE